MKITCLLAACLLFGCGDGVVNSTPHGTLPCHNITQEFTVGVPFPWDVMDDEESTVMTNGCTLTTITHYILDDTGGGGGGGSAPDPRHCDVDGCGGPIDRKVPYTDPAETIKNLSALIQHNGGYSP